MKINVEFHTSNCVIAVYSLSADWTAVVMSGDQVGPLCLTGCERTLFTRGGFVNSASLTHPGLHLHTHTYTHIYMY